LDALGATLVSALTFDNLKLGTYGLLDALSRVDDAVGLPGLIDNRNNAAGEYSAQVAAGGASYSSTLDAISDPKKKTEAARIAAKTAEDAGALGTAAARTGEQLAQGAVGIVKKLTNLAPWLLGGAALIAGAVIVSKLAPSRKKAA
jgi:hypothetical protein